MATFDEFWNTLKIGLEAFAEQSWNTYKNAALKDGQNFLDKSKTDLEDWIQQLSAKEITIDDFKWNVKGLGDVAELDALEKDGLAKAALDSFTNGLINVVVSTAIKVFL